MTPLANPSGCHFVRYRIYRPRRVTLLQRIARAFTSGATVWAEQLDILRSQA